MKKRFLITTTISYIKLIVTALSILLSIAANSALAVPGFSEVLSGQHRSAKTTARDGYRHPTETLAFFDVNPDMTVVEIWPGGGWYTEILAPYVRDQGKLYVAHFSDKTDVKYFTKSLGIYKKKLSEYPDVYDKVIMTTLNPPEELNIAPAASADRILTFRNVHNWLSNQQELNVFRAMYKALKPGGIVGVVEHRAKPGTSRETMQSSGYVTEALVIQAAEFAGFTLVAKSEINANSKDTTDHPKGVWTLLPSLALKEKDKDKYTAIGESDRMTLMFVKPEK